jgi:hypothetical protein
LGCPLDQILKIPTPFRIANQVQAGLGQIQPRDLQSAAEERSYAQRRRNFLGAKHGLSTEGRIVVDYKVIKIESGLGKQSQADCRHIHGPSQRQTYGIDNPVSQAIRAGPYQKEREQHDKAHRHESAAPGSPKTH